MAPITVIPCNILGCTQTLHVDPGDVGPKMPWYCESHINSCVPPGEHPTTTLECAYEGCTAGIILDVADQIPSKWWCSEHRAKPIVAQQPTISFLTDYAAQQVYHEEETYLKILEMIQFKTLSKDNLERVLNVLAVNCYTLGRKDSQHA